MVFCGPSVTSLVPLFLSVWKPGSLPMFLGFLLLWTALPHVPVEIQNRSLLVPPALPPAFLQFQLSLPPQVLGIGGS